MQFASGLSKQLSLPDAIQELVAQAGEQLSGQPPDLVIVFLSGHHTHAIRQLVDGLQGSLNPGVIIGCTAEGVIGREEEVENQPGITMLAAHLPDVSITPFFLQSTNWPALLLDQEEFQRMVGAPVEVGLFLTLGDPFSAPMEDVLEAFNAHYPGIPVVGGMASGALRPQGNALFINDRIAYEGVVGAALSGAFDAEVIVSQGCRPIWQPLIVQTASKNIIYNLEGQPPLAWIQEMVPELSEEERLLLQNGLFVGRAIDPSREAFGRGDFLIRGVVGVDQQNGAIAIGDSIMEGEVIQFHLRDALTAKEDLEMMLIPQTFRDPPLGAFLFSCNGRGMRLYDYPNGDISVIQRSLGSPPLAGFFCAGEIGPVAGQNFLHGHTASLVVFRQLDKS
jgi:small ligand-binding sensory domain FIST